VAKIKKPDRKEAEEAVRTLIRWAGDNPEREGLIDTPKRVVKAYKEMYSGYEKSPEEILERTFGEVDGYDEMVVLTDIEFESHCEHHMLPIIGKAHIGYIPNSRVVGISKLARVVNIFAKRMQIQEKFTSQIANAIQNTLEPRGVAVVAEATHHCMTTRGVHKHGAKMKTSHMTGLFRSDARTRREFFHLIEGKN